jgi:hypothetical protein
LIVHLARFVFARLPGRRQSRQQLCPSVRALASCPARREANASSKARGHAVQLLVRA